MFKIRFSPQVIRILYARRDYLGLLDTDKTDDNNG
jgi:hypothetical protein